MSESIKCGANGYLLKNADKDELVYAIGRVMAGNAYISSEIALKFLEKYNPEKRKVEKKEKINFTKREIEILGLISEGYTNLQIADKIFISKRTVEFHRKALLEKTKSKNTPALIKYAAINGIFKV